MSTLLSRVCCACVQSRYVAAKHRLDDGTWSSVLRQLIPIVLSPGVDFGRQSKLIGGLTAVLSSRKAKPDSRVLSLDWRMFYDALARTHLTDVNQTTLRNASAVVRRYVVLQRTSIFYGIVRSRFVVRLMVQAAHATDLVQFTTKCNAYDDSTSSCMVLTGHSDLHWRCCFTQILPAVCYRRSCVVPSADTVLHCISAMHRRAGSPANLVASLRSSRRSAAWCRHTDGVDERVASSNWVRIVGRHLAVNRPSPVETLRIATGHDFPYLLSG